MSICLSIYLKICNKNFARSWKIFQHQFCVLSKKGLEQKPLSFRSTYQFSTLKPQVFSSHSFPASKFVPIKLPPLQYSTSRQCINPIQILWVEKTKRIVPAITLRLLKKSTRLHCLILISGAHEHIAFRLTAREAFLEDDTFAREAFLEDLNTF